MGPEDHNARQCRGYDRGCLMPDAHVGVSVHIQGVLEGLGYDGHMISMVHTGWHSQDKSRAYILSTGSDRVSRSHP